MDDDKGLDYLKGVPYVFESAQQLLADFFREVDKVLKGIK